MDIGAKMTIILKVSRILMESHNLSKCFFIVDLVNNRIQAFTYGGTFITGIIFIKRLLCE